MKLSLERLRFLAANPSEVYAKETQAMARMCINAHPDSFMDEAKRTPEEIQAESLLASNPDHL